MARFTQLEQWKVESNGDISLKFKADDGSMRQATFSRDTVIQTLIVLNRMFIESSEQFPEGLRDLFLSQVPIESASMALPGGEYALAIRTQSGAKHHFPMVPGTYEMLSSALADLRAIEQAESEAHQSGSMQ